MTVCNSRTYSEKYDKVCCFVFVTLRFVCFLFTKIISEDMKFERLKKKIKVYLPTMRLLKSVYHRKYRKLIMYRIQFMLILAVNFLIFN